MASRAEQKQQARAARLAREAGAARAGRRRRNLIQLGIVAAVAVAVLVGVIAASGGKSGGSGSLGPQRAEVAALFAGVPQHGTQLGKPNAPYTLVEFADLQCPVCREYTLNVMPSVIRDYVRTGKIKVDLKLRTFLGPDSVKAARVAAGAAQQSRVWPFADLFYRQQGEENSGYVTPAFLKKIATATPGLNAPKALAASNSAAASRLIRADESLANSFGSNQTPDFFLRRDGGRYRPVSPSALTPQAMADALNAAISQ